MAAYMEDKKEQELKLRAMSMADDEIDLELLRRRSKGIKSGMAIYMVVMKANNEVPGESSRRMRKLMLLLGDNIDGAYIWNAPKSRVFVCGIPDGGVFPEDVMDDDLKSNCTITKSGIPQQEIDEAIQKDSPTQDPAE